MVNVYSLSILQGNKYGGLLFGNLEPRQVRVFDSYPKVIFLKQVYSEGKPDILHLHTIHHFFQGKNTLRRWLKFFLFVSQIVILKLSGIRVVWTVHEWFDKFEGKWGDINPFWARTLGYLFDGIITHCQSTKDVIQGALKISDSKIHVVPHGNYIGAYENEINQEKSRLKLNIPSGKVTFLLFGNIFRSKGFLEAIHAFQQLPQDQTSLLIVGFPAEQGIESVIRSMIHEYSNIHFEPRKIDDREIQVYMNACDCVVIPYKVFTTSGVTILAMSFKKACIAPKMGYFSDVLDESGSFLYAPESDDGLMFAMRSALQRQNCLADMGSHNFDKVHQWDWGYVADETLKVYKKCMS